jgi:hypothetical protein
MVIFELTERPMRRSLALTDETAGHPFLASLPPHVRRGIEVAQRNGEELPARGHFRFGVQDVKDFLIAYCACFMAVSIFIA